MANINDEVLSYVMQHYVDAWRKTRDLLEGSEQRDHTAAMLVQAASWQINQMTQARKTELRDGVLYTETDYRR